MTLDTNHFKQKLEEERQRLEGELSKVGRRSPSNPNDWEPSFEDINNQAQSQDEMADKFEEMEQTLAIQSAYENRYNAVKAALERIEAGKYGTCATCGKDINPERIEVDPTSSTCGEHE